jgi:hypothetical protein
MKKDLFGLAHQVSDQVDVDDLSVLRKDADDVALGQVVGQAADEDPGGVRILNFEQTNITYIRNKYHKDKEKKIKIFLQESVL